MHSQQTNKRLALEQTLELNEEALRKVVGGSLEHEIHEGFVESLDSYAHDRGEQHRHSRNCRHHGYGHHHHGLLGIL